MSNRPLLFLLLLVMASSVTAYLPDKCVMNPPYTCAEYKAVWGSSGADGEIYIVVQENLEHGNFTDLTALTVREDKWKCVLQKDPLRAWENRQLFYSKNCSFESKNKPQKLDAEIYANDGLVGTMKLRVEDVPPSALSFMDKHGDEIALWSYLLLPLVLSIAACWAAIRFLRKQLHVIAWIAMGFIVGSVFLVFTDSRLAEYLVFFVFSPFMVVPSTVSAVAGIGAYRARRKKTRWPLLVPIIIGGLFVILTILFWTLLLLEPMY